MSVYSLAHVLDVPGWPTVWGLEVERWEVPAAKPAPRVSAEVKKISNELASITQRLQRLQQVGWFDVDDAPSPPQTLVR